MMEPAIRSLTRLIVLLGILQAQEVEILPVQKSSIVQKSSASFKCEQPSVEQEKLMREAIKNQFWVRRVEFIGNEHTRDQTLRRRLKLREGDIFTRKNLDRSLRSLNKLKRIIYPVKLSDVIIRLNTAEKIIDIEICFNEKPAASRQMER